MFPPNHHEDKAAIIVGALRKKYRTSREVVRALGLDEALFENPTETAKPKSRGMMAVMARLAARSTSEEWAQLYDDLRAVAGGTEAEDDQVPEGLAVKPDIKTTDLPLVSGMDRILALDGHRADGRKLDRAGMLKLSAHIKTSLY